MQIKKINLIFAKKFKNKYITIMGNTKFTTGKVRLSYQSIWSTKIEDGKDTEKYTACILVPKSDTKTVDLFKRGIEEVTNAVKAGNGGKLPSGFKNPMRDGDVEKQGDVNFEGHYYINMSSKFPPKIVDRNRNTLTDSSTVVSGDYIRVIVNLFPYNVSKNSGVGVGFNGIQLIEKGEYLGGSGAQFDDEYSDGDGFDDDLPI